MSTVQISRDVFKEAVRNLAASTLGVTEKDVRKLDVTQELSIEVDEAVMKKTTITVWQYATEDDIKRLVKLHE